MLSRIWYAVAPSFLSTVTHVVDSISYVLSRTSKLPIFLCAVAYVAAPNFLCAVAYLVRRKSQRACRTAAPNFLFGGRVCRTSTVTPSAGCAVAYVLLYSLTGCKSPRKPTLYDRTRGRGEGGTLMVAPPTLLFFCYFSRLTREMAHD